MQNIFPKCKKNCVLQIIGGCHVYNPMMSYSAEGSRVVRIPSKIRFKIYKITSSLRNMTNGITLDKGSILCKYVAFEFGLRSIKKKSLLTLKMYI